MRRLYILLLVTLSGASIMAAITQHDPGYIRISYGHWLLETNFWMGAILIIVFMAACYAIFRLWRLFSASDAGMRGWFKHAGKRRAQNLTTKGLLAFAEGNWKQAQSHLTSAAKKSETPLINYLAAVQAAYEQGHEEDTKALLNQAWKSTAGSDLAVGLTQAQLYLDNHKNEQCLATLLRLKKDSPQHPFLLKLLKVVYVRLGDWQQLSLLLPDLLRYRVVQGIEYDNLEIEVWSQLIKQTAQEIKRQKGSSFSTERLCQQWERIPGKLQKNPDLVYAYTAELIALGDGINAELLIRKTLNHHWHDKLVRLYGLLPGLTQEEPNNRHVSYAEALITAENWLKARPNNAPLLLCLGRLALRNQLWGKAKQYMEASHSQHKTKETYAELCRLALYMDDKDTSAEYLLQGVLSQVGLPDLPMPKPKSRN
jgi:HemY protein